MEEKKINHSTKESYEKLSTVLYSLGLTFEDIKKEFEAPRIKPENTPGYTFAHGRVISTPSKIIPERIQNGSYSNDTPSLKAWFERDFRNSSIFEHIGDYDVVDKIQDDQNMQFDAINGMLFLHEDGNHRLFNYLLLAIIDQKISKNGKSVLQSRDRFTLHNKAVHFEHPKKMIEAFDAYVNSSNSNINQNVKDYIAETFAGSDVEEAGQSDYLTFDPNTKNYSLFINGKEYSNIPASKITQIIETEPDLPSGVKIWKVKDTFYISSNNKVFHTKDKDEFSIMVQNVFNHLSTLPPPYDSEYLVIKNLDEQIQNTTIKTTARSYNLYDNEKLSSKNIVEFRKYLTKNFKALINNLPTKDIHALELIINSNDTSSIDLPALEFYGLTEKRCSEVEEILINGLHILNPEKQKEYQQCEEK